MSRCLVKYLFLTFFWFSITPTHSQDQNSVLWKISGNGLTKASYLYGIINFLPKDKYVVSEQVIRLMGQCDLFITRTPPTKASQKEFNKAARIPNDGWINDYLSDDELNQLRLLMLKKLEVTEHDYHFTYSRLQPVILVTATTLLYLGENVVFVEEELARLAKKERLKFNSLSTIDQEIEAFNKFPIPDQVEALKHTVANWDEHIEDYNQLVRSYVIDKDLKMIHEEILKSTNRSELFQDAYYYSRNKMWAAKIKDLLGTNSALIVVGAAHFYGESGLIQLLMKEGYTVIPVDDF